MKLAQLVKEKVPILEYAQYRGLTPKKVGPCEYILKEHDSIPMQWTTTPRIHLPCSNSFFVCEQSDSLSMIEPALIQLSVRTPLS